MNDTLSPIEIRYFSDLLCIWAYLAEIKLDELRHNYGDRLVVENRFVPVFGSVPNKIRRGWSDRGGLAGYAAHVREVASGFDHVEVHPDVWIKATPTSSLGAHAFVKAAQTLAREGSIREQPVEAFERRTPTEELAWQLRLAFFRDCRDIARLDVQLDVARALDLPAVAIRERVEDSSGVASLFEDHELAVDGQIGGSPTFVLNQNRQKLYGNVGYRIIDANIQELLRDNSDIASWC